MRTKRGPQKFSDEFRREAAQAGERAAARGARDPKKSDGLLRRIAAFSGSRSVASNFFHVSRVNLSSLTRSMVATIRHQHSITTGGAGLLAVTTSGPG